MTSTGAGPRPHMCRCWSMKSSPRSPFPGETVVDGTFGAGGYTRAMLAAGAGRVIGFDRDPDAIEEGRSLVPDPA
jgi:16S rRNA (cytosine1402-N4)-methyltransferase